MNPQAGQVPQKLAKLRTEVDLWNREYPPHTLVRLTAGTHRGQLARTMGMAYLDATLTPVIVLRRWRIAFPLAHLRVIPDEIRVNI